ncbi:unnamed protein product [Adineta ricciae]|uniref:Uncharacterized protein n=1 Tax=Adineta ricciae TaxID=249248 RepID=A0A815LT76_ADIRI|nr:unnamed protein product [Adineta ricciae]
MTTSSKSPCSISGCKSVGIYNCQGCQRSFCKKHVTEHNMELSKEMDNVVNHHDLLQQELTQQNVTLDNHSLMKEINDWQHECMEKIRRTAEEARCKLTELITDNTQSLTQQLKLVSDQLKSSKENDEYSEIDLTQWMDALTNLKKRMETPPNIKLRKINHEVWLQRLEITATSMISSDKFDKTCGDVKILANGSVVEHSGATGNAEVRGFAAYSHGVYKISLKIERMTNNYWMLWGIISQNTSMQVSSYSSKSSYGWAKNQKQVYLNGENNNGYNDYDGDVCENDVLYLTLNCDERYIQLENERTKKKYTIPIDLTKCPFPWQLHINLYSANDRISIL